MEEMKLYTEDEMLDKHIGRNGTPDRDAFESEFNTFLIGEECKQKSTHYCRLDSALRDFEEGHTQTFDSIDILITYLNRS